MKILNNFVQRRGFTDRLYFLNLKLTWIFVWACFILNIFSGLLGIQTLDIITYGVPAAFAELAIHTGFIIWKAKVENISKYKDLKEDIDILNL